MRNSISNSIDNQKRLSTSTLNNDSSNTTTNNKCENETTIVESVNNKLKDLILELENNNMHNDFFTNTSTKDDISFRVSPSNLKKLGCYLFGF